VNEKTTAGEATWLPVRTTGTGCCPKKKPLVENTSGDPHARTRILQMPVKPTFNRPKLEAMRSQTFPRTIIYSTRMLRSHGSILKHISRTLNCVLTTVVVAFYVCVSFQFNQEPDMKPPNQLSRWKSHNFFSRIQSRYQDDEAHHCRPCRRICRRLRPGCQDRL
jgi:hypothetical protein